MKSKISLVVPLIAWATACWAGDEADCTKAMTQSEMNRCAANNYERADAALNQVYSELLSALDASRRQGLIAAERRWISFRDAQCQEETARSEGGSIHPLLYDTCLTELTRKRTQELRNSLECERGVGKCND